jgi:Zn-dependent protease
MALFILPLIILIVSIIAHEVAHGYAADSLGDPTPRLAGRLTLNPLAHIDPMGSIVIPALLVLSHSPIFFGWAKPVPYNPYNLRHQRWGEMWVALAGITTNLLIALIFGLFVRYGLGSAATLTISAEIAFTNLFLGLFNLIPFPPLDGFTALRAALPWNLSSGMRRLEQRLGAGGGVSLILFLLLFSYVLAGPFYKLVVILFGLLTGVGI